MPALPVLIFLIFLVLKLAEAGVVADWSWWWVTAPLWISAALYAVFVLPLQLLIASKARKTNKAVHDYFNSVHKRW